MGTVAWGCWLEVSALVVRVLGGSVSVVGCILVVGSIVAGERVCIGALLV